MADVLIFVTQLLPLAFVIVIVWLAWRGVRSFRDFHESNMTDAVRITAPRVAAAPEGDPAARPTVYEGKAVVRTDQRAAKELDDGDRPTTAPVVVKIPWDVGGVRPGQLVTVLAARRSPQAVDRQFVVAKSNHHAPAATSRRMVCTALVEPQRTAKPD